MYTWTHGWSETFEKVYPNKSQNERNRYLTGRLIVTVICFTTVLISHIRPVAKHLWKPGTDWVNFSWSASFFLSWKSVLKIINILIFSRKCQPGWRLCSTRALATSLSFIKGKEVSLQKFWYFLIVRWVLLVDSDIMSPAFP